MRVTGWWALQRLRIRANQGDAAAQFELGAAYRLGQGVRHNRVLALGWMLLAARQGDNDAEIQATLLAEELTPEQVERAMRWARKNIKRGREQK